MPKQNLGVVVHPCTQCELADSANAFLVWFRAFIGRTNQRGFTVMKTVHSNSMRIIDFLENLLGSIYRV